MEPSLDTLPEELKSLVISYLDLDPPSAHWCSQRPSSALADCNPKPLKNLSAVSKAWRRLVKPTLFRCIRMHLKPNQLATNWLTTYQRSNFHRTLETRKVQYKSSLFNGDSYPHDAEWAYRHSWQDMAPPKAAQWITMLESYSSDLLFFLGFSGLTSGVQTLAVVFDQELDNGNSPDWLREEVHCLIGSATFWDVLLRPIDSFQVTVVAPPSTLGCILNCSVSMQDAWAFPGMGLQLVTLQRPHAPRYAASQPHSISNRAESVHLRLGQNDAARPAMASLLYLRPWTHIMVNEGCYLQAYETYEYFHKEPPGIAYPIAQGFEVPMSIHSLTYHAQFPLHDYLAAVVNLMSTGMIRNLHVQLAPDPHDDIFNNTSKVDMNDCWSEVELVYRLLFTGTAAAPTPEDSHLAAHSNMTTFSSGDYRIESIKALLDSSFAALQWDSTRNGMWEITHAALARRRAIQGLENDDDE